MTGVVISMHCKGSLKRDLRLNYQHLSFLPCLLPSSAYVYQHFKAKSDLGGEKNMLAIQFNECYILKHVKVGKRYLFIFITLGVTSFSFSNCTEELGSRLVLLYTV